MATKQSHYKKMALTDEQLKNLFRYADWSVLNDWENKSYGKFPIVSLFKAQLLPYLLPLTSERPLAREFRGRRILQNLCGIEDSSVARSISRQTLWRFRKEKCPKTFPQVLRSLLISLAVASFILDIKLPYLESQEYTEISRLPDVGFYIKNCHWKLWIHKNDMNPMDTHIYRQSLLLAHEMAPSRNVSNNFPKKLWEDIGFPAILQQHSSALHRQQWVLETPLWLKERKKLGVDPLTTVGPANTSKVACVILIIRELGNNKREVLLSKRKSGKGVGKYQLPGGKISIVDTSIRAGAKRELKKETGLKLLDSIPVSLREEKLYDDRPKIKTVGVLAIKFEGKVTHNEQNQNTMWEWFPLDRLPEPLFEPTEMVMRDFLHKNFPTLTWNEVEESELENHPQMSLPFDEIK